GNPLSELERLRELVTGLQVEDPDPRLDLRQQVEDHATLRPERRRHGQLGEEGLHRPAEDLARVPPGELLRGFGPIGPGRCLGRHRSTYPLSAMPQSYTNC